MTIYTLNELQKEALKYKTRTTFRDNNNKMYRYAIKIKKLDNICTHMTGHTKWTKIQVLKIAKQFRTVSEMLNEFSGAYAYARKENFVSDLVFNNKTKPTRKLWSKWTEETITIEALKYTTRTEFSHKAQTCYYKALELNILDNVCNHMKRKPLVIKQLNNKKGIYLLYRNNEVVYVGKTVYNIAQRITHHYRKNEKIFDKIEAYIVNNNPDIHIVELYLIDRYKPIYNKGDYDPLESATIIIQNIDDIIVETIKLAIPVKGT